MEHSIAAQSAASHNHAHSDSRYLEYLHQLHKLTESITQPVFKVNVTKEEGLAKLWLNAINPEIRQIYNCHTCFRFINKYGGLVTVDPDSDELVPLLWGKVTPPGYLRWADETLHSYVKSCSIRVPFFARPGVLGTPKTTAGYPNAVDFHHFSCLVPQGAFCTDKEPHVKAAEVREEYRSLRFNLGSYKLSIFEDAANFIATCGNSLYSCKTTADYMLSLKRLHDTVGRKVYENILWNSLAKAPKPAFHLNTTIYGVILDSFAKGVAIDRLRQQLNIYQDPLKYRRPTEAPTSQAIKAATKFVQDLGLTDALPRRFARFDEIPSSEIVWQPTLKHAVATKEDPFANIVPKEKSVLVEARRGLDHLSNPPSSYETVSLTHFINNLLPLADALYLVNPPGSTFPIGAFTAPAVDNAPPILQWDVHLANQSNNTIRNPLAHFVFSSPFALNRTQVILVPNPSTYLYPIEAVIPLPANWHNAQPDGDYKGSLLYIKDAVIVENRHNGLFPAFLPSNLHSLSSVIEAYAKQNVLPPSDNQVAGVVMTNAGFSTGLSIQLCLTRGRISTVYKISSVN